MYYFSTLTKQTNNTTKRPRFNTKMMTPNNSSSFIQEYTSSNNWLAIIDSSYISDAFNIYGIEDKVPNFQIALQVILEDDFDSHTIMSPTDLQQTCEIAYGYIHQRYIITPNGFQAIRRKYELGIYGACPRFNCNGQNLLPIGLSQEMGVSEVKTYCPKCKDIYHSNQQLDGANFGPYFPHLFQQLNQDVKFPKSTEQSQFDFLGIPIHPDSQLNPHRVIRDYRNQQS